MTVIRAAIQPPGLRRAEHFQRLLGTKLVYSFNRGSPHWRLLGQPHNHLTDAVVAGDLLRRIDDLKVDPLHGIKA